MNCIKCGAAISDESIYCMYCGKKQTKEPRKNKKRANGLGSVYKLSGNRKRPFYAVHTKIIDGEVTRIPIGTFETRTEALAAINKVERQHIPDMFNATLEDVYNYVYEHHISKLSKDAQGCLTSAWNYIKKYRKYKMRELLTDHYQEGIDSAEQLGYGRATQEKIRQLVSLVCKKAMRDKIIDRNYAKFLTLQKQKKVKKQIFKQNEIQTLFDHSTDRDAQIILVMIHTGVRPNELFLTTKNNVDIENRLFVSGSKTEAGLNRTIPINDKILPFFKQWMSSEGTYLITNTKGGKVDEDNYRYRNFYPYLESLGIDNPVANGKRRLTPNSCRHTFISNMVSKNCPPEILQLIVGHEQYETTVNNYKKITEEDISCMKNAVNML